MPDKNKNEQKGIRWTSVAEAARHLRPKDPAQGGSSRFVYWYNRQTLARLRTV